MIGRHHPAGTLGFLTGDEEAPVITDSDLDLIARAALDALAVREAAATPAPATPCPDDDDRDGSSRDAM